MLVVTNWQCHLERSPLAVQLLRQAARGGDAPDFVVYVACGGRGREGPSWQQLHHTVTVGADRCAAIYSLSLLAHFMAGKKRHGQCPPAIKETMCSCFVEISINITQMHDKT